MNQTAEYYMIKGLVASMPANEQVIINELADKIKALINDVEVSHPNCMYGITAIALVGLEIQQ